MFRPGDRKMRLYSCMGNSIMITSHRLKMVMKEDGFLQDKIQFISIIFYLFL